MFSLKCMAALGLIGWSVAGCSSDATVTGSAGASSGGASNAAAGESSGGSAQAGSGTAGSSSVPDDCDAVGAQQKSRITALGCDDTSATIAAGCKALYAANACVTEWETLIDCITPKPNSDFECDDDNELAPKTGVCTSQRTAFDDCIGN